MGGRYDIEIIIVCRRRCRIVRKYALGKVQYNIGRKADTEGNITGVVRQSMKKWKLGDVMYPILSKQAVDQRSKRGKGQRRKKGINKKKNLFLLSKLVSFVCVVDGVVRLELFGLLRGSQGLSCDVDFVMSEGGGSLTGEDIQRQARWMGPL